MRVSYLHLNEPVHQDGAGPLAHWRVLRQVVVGPKVPLLHLQQVSHHVLYDEYLYLVEGWAADQNYHSNLFSVTYLPVIQVKSRLETALIFTFKIIK